MASKDVSIEILNDEGSPSVSGSQLLCNNSFNNNDCWIPTTVWTVSGGYAYKAVGGSGNDLYFENPYNFIEGRGYELRIRFSNFNRNGQVYISAAGVNGANIPLLNANNVCSGCDGNTGTFATITANWVQGSSNPNKLRIYANSNVAVDVAWIQMYETMADPSIVRGRLDASTTDDFPLALTFSVNDPSEIEARKGSYSKTFQIPATKNNNRILKHFNIANSSNLGAILSKRLKCRILVGNLYSLVGLLEIKAVERLNDKPIFYSCVFLGDNLAWSTLLDDKFLSDLQLDNSTDLKISAANIIKTWDSDDYKMSTNRFGSNYAHNSPVVYPVATYGWCNETGFNYGSSMQLIREKWEEDYMNNNTVDYNDTGLAYAYFIVDANGNYSLSSKEPVNDWRPMVWIKTMIEKIFTDIGYKISSNFMDSPEFEKLLYASPNFLYNNPNQRWQANSYIGNFKDETCGGAVPTSAELEFFDNTSEITGLGFPNSSGTYTSITPNNFITTSGIGAGVQFGGTCNSCVAGDCGSGRFQPAPGVIVNSATLLQQNLTVAQNGLGTGADPFFTEWTIDAAGYYDITTENIMYYINIANALSGGWGGGGNLALSNNTGINNLYGGLLVQSQPPGSSNWYVREWPTEDSQVLNDGFWSCTDNIGFGATLDSHTFTGYFNKGDKVRFIVGVLIDMKVLNPNTNYTDGTTTVDIQMELVGTRYNNWASSNGKVSIKLAEPEVPVFGGVYDLQDVFSNEQSQLEFIKGVAHSFNLQFSTDEESRTVEIEPFSDFYLPPTYAIDWTEKLARNESDDQAFIKTDFSRRVIFKYKTDDKDWRVNDMSEKHFEGVGDMYPKIMDLGNLYPSGDSIFENPFFAGTYDSQAMLIGVLDNPGTNFYTAALWETAYGQTEKGLEYLPRMLYYNKMTMPVDHAPSWQGFNIESAGTTNYRFTSRRLSVADVTTQTQNWFQGSSNMGNAFYNSATSINRHDFTNQFGLTYGNYWAKDYDASTNTYNAVGDQVGKGLYERYYSPMISGLLAIPKVRTCYIDLKITDVVQLNFRKMVYIDGVYYRLVKVVDYQPHLNVPTKVILHQFSTAIGVSLPTEGVWVNTNNTGGGGILNEDGSTDEPVPIPAV